MEENENLPDQQQARSAISQPHPVEPDANSDWSEQVGVFPVGTSVGAVATGAVNAIAEVASGSVSAVVGAVVGNRVGKDAAKAINPTLEDAYWRENYHSRPYVKPGRSYEDYARAYQIGYEGFVQSQKLNQTYEGLEPELRHEYESQPVPNQLAWDEVKYATRDAWDRAENYTLSYREDAYWRTHYTEQPYYQATVPYDVYQLAFRVGYEGYLRYRSTGRTFDEVESDLQHDYTCDAGSQSLPWEAAKLAARAAWNRVDRLLHPSNL
jgi:hypothetical protein